MNLLTQENSLLQDPIVITATMPKTWRNEVINLLATCVAARKVSQVRILIRKIVWDGVAADGDVLTITNAGATLLTLVGTAGVPQTVAFCPLANWSDFQVTLSS